MEMVSDLYAMSIYGIPCKMYPRLTTRSVLEYDVFQEETEMETAAAEETRRR